MLYPVFQMMFSPEDSKAARFEFRLETLRLGGREKRVIACRAAWADADPEIAEYADLEESPPDSAISKQQAIWFICFMMEQTGPVDKNLIDDRMVFKVLRICEAIMEVDG